MDELLKFHFVFDTHEISPNFYDVFEAIDECVLKNFKDLKAKFEFDTPLRNEMKTALMQLAKSDQKRFNIYKIFPQQTAKKIYKELFERGIIIVEKSLEEPIKPQKRQLLKKHLRRYKVEDKIRFSSNFTRFWFYFIQPNLPLLEEGKFELLSQEIRQNFDDYASFSFELVCREFLAHKFGILSQNVSSLWARNVEIDLFLQARDQIIIGEAKFKQHKMCKNILNLLSKKCDKLSLKADKFVLFSKSGFSKELEKLKDERVMLFGIKDFEELING